ncbi:MAG: biotin synthase, partial [Caulobacter sp.]|nr:biotin synthase [Caulobacter sp.]
IFVGGKLLTTPLPGMDEDSKLFQDLDLRPMGGQVHVEAKAHSHEVIAAE